MKYRVETRCKGCGADVGGKVVRPDEHGSFLAQAMAGLPKTCPACGVAVPADAEMTLFAGIVVEEMGLSMARRPELPAEGKSESRNAA